MANKACLNDGHNGAASESSQVQMDSLFDVTAHLSEYFTNNENGFTFSRNIKDSMIPGGIGSFKLSRAGEIIYYYQGKPVAFITRLASENGCDANIGKWYRKQWYFENHLKKINPDCNHITFIHASSSTGMLADLIDGVNMVMSLDYNQEGFNRQNLGGNSIYVYDTDKTEDTWRNVSATIISVVALTLCKMKIEACSRDLFSE